VLDRQSGPPAKQSLLGTFKRRDGTRQVAYAGRPLYYYADEARARSAVTT